MTKGGAMYGITIIFQHFNGLNTVTLPFHFRSWRQPASASHRWLRSHRGHPSKWKRPSAAQVLEGKWNAGSGFPAEPGKCVLGAVFRVLWAAPLCCNKKPAWIHTGTGNTNSSKFAAYVYISSFFPSSFF